MYIDPKFDPLALSSTDWPAIPIVWATPGMPSYLPPDGNRSPLYFSPLSPSAIRSIRASTSCVRSSDAESGSWTLTSM